MAVTQPTFKPLVRSGASSVKITNLALAATTETGHLLEDDLRQVVLRARTRTRLRIAFSAGDTATSYVTIRKDAVFTLDDLEFSGKTIYIQSDDATTVEILELFV